MEPSVEAMLAEVKRSGTRELSLSARQLTLFPEALRECESLERLDLSGNLIPTIPEWISRLENLRELNLHGNILAILPEALLSLPKLQILDVGSNSLRKTAERPLRGAHLPAFENLQELDLSANRQRWISDWIGELQGLRVLKLDHNRIATFPDVLSRLHNLKRLDLSENDLEAIPEAIAELESLEELNLSGNRITEVPEVLANLRNLRRLHLGWNSVAQISEEIASLEKLEELGLRGNPIHSPPREVCQQGLAAIRSFFEQQRQQGSAPLLEARVLIVGDGGSGKTTLCKKLCDPDYRVPQQEKETLGVSTDRSLAFPVEGVSDRQLTAHLWDFGGQPIQYMIHQYFLTGGCLYVLVADDRKGETEFDYWLWVISILGKDHETGTPSPLLIVLNSPEGHELTQTDVAKLQGAFPELPIHTANVNLAGPSEPIRELRTRIQGLVMSLPNVHSKVPALWAIVRDSLKERPEPHISYAEYLRECKDAGLVDESSCRVLSRTLDALGTILHRTDDPILEDFVVLRPNWLLDAFYVVLSDSELEASSGRFSKEWIFTRWKARGYSIDECLRLLQLMSREHFELCFPVPGSDDEFVTAQLLPRRAPVSEWDPGDALEMRYVYEHRPKGLMARLIVRLNDWIVTTEDGHPWVWRTGVVVALQGAQAHVEEKRADRDGADRIEIRAQGPDRARRDLMLRLRIELDSIHQTSFPGLSVETLIPCGCEDTSSRCPSKFFEASELDKLLRFDQRMVFCTQHGKPRAILSMLEGVADSVSSDDVPPMVLAQAARADESRIWASMADLCKMLRSAQALPPRIYNQATASSEADPNVSVQISIRLQNELAALRGALGPLLEDLQDGAAELPEGERKRIALELTPVQGAVKEIGSVQSPDALRESGALDRIRSFVEKLGDTTTAAGKAFESIENGAKTAQKIGRLYNGIADTIGMGLPKLPEVLVGKAGV